MASTTIDQNISSTVKVVDEQTNTAGSEVVYSDEEFEDTTQGDAKKQVTQQVTQQVMQQVMQQLESNVELRPILIPGYKRFLNIVKNNKTGNKLVHAFCGVGKSRFALKCCLKFAGNNKRSVIVFPSIALITQFYDDHLSNKHIQTISICSKNETNNHNSLFTTKKRIISDFITKNTHCIILCTYQSLNTFTKSITSKIDLVIFDEAHHTTSPEYKKIIYKHNTFYSLGLFLTATPTHTMKQSMERISYIPYYQALEKNILKPFEIRIDIDKKLEDSYENIFKSISRTALISGNTNIMSFHTLANPSKDNRTSVSDFVDSRKKLPTIFNTVLNQEFPTLVKKKQNTKFRVKGITANTKNRTKILNSFEKSGNNKLYILSSCRAIGEGVDTRNANMCVFADPKTSHKDIIQNIGRILRKSDSDKPASILIPTSIDIEEYKTALDNNHRDQILRQNLNNSDDYSSIINVVSALMQDNEEYFNKCLNYPSLTNEKIKKTIGKKEQKTGNTIDDIISDLDDDEKSLEHDEDRLQTYATRKNINIKCFTNNPLNIEHTYGEPTDEKRPEIIISKLPSINTPTQMEYTLYQDQDEVDEKYPNVCPLQCKCRKCKLEKEEKMKKLLKDVLNIKIHTNPEFKVLWKINEQDLADKILNVSIDCVVHDGGSDHWFNRLQDTKTFIKDNDGKAPGTEDKNKDGKSMGGWIGTQKKNYSPDKNKRKDAMKNDDVAEAWEQARDDYPDIFLTTDEVWFIRLEEIKTFIKDNDGKTPRKEDKNKDGKSLGRWIGRQKTAYSQDKNKRKKAMKNDDVAEAWEQFMDDYPNVFKGTKIYKEYIEAKNNGFKNVDRIGKEIKDSTKVLCECGTKLLEKNMEKHKKSKGHAKNMEKNMQKHKKSKGHAKNMEKSKKQDKVMGVLEAELCKKTLKQLRSICREKGLSGYSVKSKDNLIYWMLTKLDKLDKEEEEEAKPLQSSGTEKKCVHIYEEKYNDGEWVHKKCIQCGRCMRRSLDPNQKGGYTEPNPEIKRRVNEWLGSYGKYEGTEAFILDSRGLKTTNSLIKNKAFVKECISIVEYDSDIYEENLKDAKFGSCMLKGDFLEMLKKEDISRKGLIYADFTGRYNNFVKPLLEYLGDCEDITSGVVLGVTWSNNGSGSAKNRRNVTRHLAQWQTKFSWEEFEDEECTHLDYGAGGNMNVVFMKKK